MGNAENVGYPRPPNLSDVVERRAAKLRQRTRDQFQWLPVTATLPPSNVTSRLIADCLEASNSLRHIPAQSNTSNQKDPPTPVDPPICSKGK